MTSCLSMRQVYNTAGLGPRSEQFKQRTWKNGECFKDLWQKNLSKISSVSKTFGKKKISSVSKTFGKKSFKDFKCFKDLWQKIFQRFQVFQRPLAKNLSKISSVSKTFGKKKISSVSKTFGKKSFKDFKCFKDLWQKIFQRFQVFQRPLAKNLSKISSVSKTFGKRFQVFQRPLAKDFKCFKDLWQSVSKTFGKRSFSVFGPTVWNSLPLSLRKTQRFTTFKAKLKTHLFRAHLC